MKTFHVSVDAKREFANTANHSLPANRRRFFFSLLFFHCCHSAVDVVHNADADGWTWFFFSFVCSFILFVGSNRCLSHSVIHFVFSLSAGLRWKSFSAFIARFSCRTNQKFVYIFASCSVRSLYGNELQWWMWKRLIDSNPTECVCARDSVYVTEMRSAFGKMRWKFSAEKKTNNNGTNGSQLPLAKVLHKQESSNIFSWATNFSCFVFLSFFFYIFGRRRFAWRR